MRVHVRYFAALREKVGKDADELTIPGGATVSQARAGSRAIMALKTALSTTGANAGRMRRRRQSRLCFARHGARRGR